MSESSIDPLRCIYEHVLKFHGFDLLQRNIAELSGNIGQVSLFGLSEEALRERFKSAASKAGYPDGLLSFHSLRSGFLCSALIKSGTDESARTAVLEQTAFVAGWVPGGRAQIGYVKENGKRTIISTNLVLPEKKSKLTSMELSSPELFHGIVLKPLNKYTVDIWRTFQNEMVGSWGPMEPNLLEKKINYSLATALKNNKELTGLYNQEALEGLN